MLLVNIFTATYFLYCFLYTGNKESKVPKLCVLFLFLFYWIFFLLSYFLSDQEVRDIARFVIIPVIAASVLLLPIKMESKIRKAILLFLICYVLFWLFIVILHYFSPM